MTDFKTSYQDDPICPHCGHKQRDAWDIDFGPCAEGDTTVTCGSCNEEFQCYRIVNVYYTTHKVGP